MKNEEYILEGTIASTIYQQNTILDSIKKISYLFVKRLFDIIVSLIGLLLILPVALIIKISYMLNKDFNSIFYTQKRIGLNGEEFKFYKFRSMVPNADKVLEEILKDPIIEENYKKNMKLDNDSRITKVGHFIRKYSIDELPQLLNVLNNTMSIIGNRPYLPREKVDIGDYYNDIVKTKPGITGYWQVSGRSNIDFHDRCKLESFYSNNRSLLLDIKIFFQTFSVVLLKKGAK